MSNKTEQQQVQITEVIFNAEDLAVFDQVLGNFAYKQVVPLYKIIEQRIAEAAQRIADQDKKLTAVPAKTEVEAEA